MNASQSTTVRGGRTRPPAALAAWGAVLLGALPACEGGGSGPAAAERPHVLLISLDTLRADRLGCYGYERPTSPSIDALAARGLTFLDASAPSSKTATSHMSMLSGMHPTVHGVRNTYGATGHAPHESLPLVTELLQDAGYATVGFTGGGMMSRELGFERGFDHYDDRGGGADRVFARAKEWCDVNLEDLGNEPLFLFVHTYEIHDPYTPPAEWQARFVDPDYAGTIDSTRIELPEDAAETWKTDPEFYAEVQRRFWDGYDGLREGDTEHLSDLYDAGIAYTDQLLGEFLTYLEASPVGDDLAIVLTSDHGEEFGEHGNLTHDSVFQTVLHVPLVVLLPGSDPARAERAGTTVRRPVRGVDLAPSLAELCGLDLGEEIQGTSFLPDARGELGYWDTTWSEIGSPSNELAALRWGNYKLIANRVERSSAVLFDLKIDPDERFDRKDDFVELAVHLADLMLVQEERNQALAVRFPPSEVEMGAGALGAMQALGYVDR